MLDPDSTDSLRNEHSTMVLADLLRKKAAVIAEKWRHASLAAYAEVSARAIERQQNPFANPAGHALRTGLQSAVEMLADGRPPAEIAAALDGIIQIRAVQELAPSQALAFVLLLKDIIRAEAAPAGDWQADLSVELADLERQIDQILVAAFDIYTRYRDRICDVRIREIRRSAGLAAMGSGVCR